MVPSQLAVPTPQTSSFLVSTSAHTTATSIYNVASSFLQSHDLSAHFAYSHILKLQMFENLASSTSSPSPAESSEMSPSPPPPEPGNLWIACWAERDSDHSRSLELVASVTTGNLGPHPVFLVASPSLATRGPLFIQHVMQRLAATLLERVPVERVFSVLGPKSITQAFVEAWCTAAGPLPHEDPVSSGEQRTLTRHALRPALEPIQGHRIRLAMADDIDPVTELCRQLSAHFAPYVLNLESARQEVTCLVAEKAVYVYEVPLSDGAMKIASFVAVGRTTPDYAAVTKIYTEPNYTRTGFASRLLHAVCSQLFEGGHNLVLIGAPHGSRAIDGLIAQVGFAQSGSPTSEWLEIGFQEAEQGYW